MHSQEFWVDYHRAHANEATPIFNPIEKAKVGSMNALITQYYSSQYFTSKQPSTQRTYRSQLEEFRRKFGQLPIAGVKVSHLDEILGRMATKSTAQADKFFDRLKMLFKLAVKWDYRPDNPMHHVERPKHVSIGYATWEEQDIDAYRKRWPTGSPQRIAFEVLLNTGLRRSDAVRLGKAHRNGPWHKIRTKKSGLRTEINVPVVPELEHQLDFCSPDAPTYITTIYGSSRSEKAFTNWIKDAAKAAGLPHDRAPHGLRKAACRRLAEAGCSASQIMAITGHRNIAEIERYVRDANQKILAQDAFDLLALSKNVTATKTG